MACLSESQVLGFVELGLSSEEQSTVEAHIDVCVACRQLLADVARCAPTPRRDAPLEGSSGPPVDPAPTDPDAATPPTQPTEGRSRAPLTFGTSLADRYVVLDILGIGGMGAVYAAYDRQLDRKVALKLVLPERGSEERLLREAKSLARLSHPNVVVVHDVGEALGRTYMAMELIEGRTLRRWLEEERPPAEAVLASFLAAAKGLAAAHASGLVHRDFKPDNVLIANDGRVRVTDFGLARPLLPKGVEDCLPSDPTDGPLDEASSDGAPPPRSTTLEGTPFYIAPERYLGRPSDARSDQFAFCVSLYEALYGEYPYAASSLRDLTDAMKAGRVRPPRRGSKVGSALRSALLRGLSPDPAARFPSMEALSSALREGRRRRRAFRLALVGVFAAAGAATAITALHAREAPPLCQGSDRRLAGLWDEPRRQALEQAFMKTGVPYAAATYRTVREALDRYTASWAAERTEACVATRVYGEQSEEVLDLRVACLEGQLLKLRAVLDTMAGADRAAVEKAADAASRLADPELCGSAGAMSARVPPPEGSEARAKVAAMRERLAAIDALRTLGRRAEAMDGARALFREAEELGYRPLVAEVGHVLGSMLRGKVTHDESRKVLEKALLAAEAGHHEREALGLWLDIATHSIWNDARYEEAERALNHAEAYLERLGGDSERLMLLERRSALYRAQGRIAEGTQAARDAVGLAEKAFGEGSIRVAGALMELGIMLHLSGEQEASVTALTRAIEIAERELGKEHPNVGSLLTNLGAIHLFQKRYPEAIDALGRAADIIERALGSGPPLAAALSDRAAALAEVGRLEEALAMKRRAITIEESMLSANHPDLATSYSRLGDVLAKLGRWSDAAAAFTRAYDVASGSEERRLGAEALEQAKKALGPCGAPCKATLRRLEEREKERAR